jgi:hypothetical protein
VAKALKKNREERYGSMQDAAHDLQAIQGNKWRGLRSAVLFLLIVLGLALILVWRSRGVLSVVKRVESPPKVAIIPPSSTSSTKSLSDGMAPHEAIAPARPHNLARTRLPSEAKTLSLKDARTMIVKRGFYHASWNPDAKGLPHQYEVEFLHAAPVVLDSVTGLMWQRGGSGPRRMYRQEAEDYIRSLNAQKLGGFDDWRLPTVEEAMSLMAAPEDGQPKTIDVGNEQQRGVYHVNQKFEIAGAPFMLTSDVDSSGRSWVVYFWDGICRPEAASFNSYVRVVRSTH